MALLWRSVTVCGVIRSENYVVLCESQLISGFSLRNQEPVLCVSLVPILPNKSLTNPSFKNKSRIINSTTANQAADSTHHSTANHHTHRIYALAPPLFQYPLLYQYIPTAFCHPPKRPNHPTMTLHRSPPPPSRSPLRPEMAPCRINQRQVTAVAMRLLHRRL